MPSLPQPSAQHPAPASASGAPPPEVEPSGARDLPPWQFWMAPAAVAFGFGVGAVGSILVDVAAQVGGSSIAHPTPAVSIVGDVVFDLGFVAAALYFASFRGRARAADFGFRRVRLRTALVAILAAVVGYYGLTTIYASIFQISGTDKLPSELGVGRSTVALVAASIFVCVIAPIAEEFFFRGFFFGALRRWRIEVAGHDVGTWLAAAVTGVLFGLAHTGSASSQYLIPLGFLGFVLCIVRWKTGSLYPCIVLHSANNALALGYNQLSWNVAEIAGLTLASWLVIAVITWPLGARSPAVA